MEGSRLNGARGFRDYVADPRMQEALTRLFTCIEPALANLEKLATDAPSG